MLQIEGFAAGIVDFVLVIGSKIFLNVIPFDQGANGLQETYHKSIDADKLALEESLSSNGNNLGFVCELMFIPFIEWSLQQPQSMFGEIITFHKDIASLQHPLEGGEGGRPRVKKEGLYIYK